jgi:uncharacterized protein involved in type VI secretion and phage assembly
VNGMDPMRSETEHESGGYAKGVAVAVVTQNKDPEGQCRVKVSYPWYDPPRESYWARLATPMAGGDRGIVTIPEVGDEVLVIWEREDVRFPCVIGGVWNGKDPPPETNADGKNNKRLIKSRSGHRLLFDDGTPGVVELSLQDGKKVRFDDQSVSLEDENGNHFEIDSASGSVEINANGKLTINAASVEISATGSLDLKAGATLALNGTMITLN